MRERLATALRECVARAARAASREGRTQWVALHTRVSPRDPLGWIDAAGDEGFYWERPAEGFALATAGASHVIEVRGRDRFDSATRRARTLFRAVHVWGDSEEAAPGPFLVGGFAFADAEPDRDVWRGFPSGRLVLPTRSLLRTPCGTWYGRVRGIAPGESAGAIGDALEAELGAMQSLRAHDPSGPPLPPDDDREAPCPAFRVVADRQHADYGARVGEALEAIAAGDLEKVVVARSVRLECGASPSARALLDTLRSAHPTCAIFAVAHGGATFVGATPERLLRLRGDRVETAALAGSAPRGRCPEEDARLARALVESKKEQAEHAVVVRGLRAALEPLCDELHGPEAPEVLRLAGITHLETPLVGRLAHPRHLLELAGRLHPTAAVAGAPRDAALRWLLRHEALERGWYAGAVGFVDATGDGELAVALRSALLRGPTAHLFAGAGIVPGSRPEAELRETRLKLRALLGPLLEI
jgi:isochorismate synthase